MSVSVARMGSLLSSHALGVSVTRLAAGAAGQADAVHAGEVGPQTQHPDIVAVPHRAGDDVAGRQCVTPQPHAIACQLIQDVVADQAAGVSRITITVATGSPRLEAAACEPGVAGRGSVVRNCNQTPAACLR